MGAKQVEFVLDLGLPRDAVDVNGRVWFRDLDGNRAVFVDQTPFYSYPMNDVTQHRFCAVQLVEAGLAKVRDVCVAFEIHDRAFSRYRSSFRKQGIAGLVPQKVGRKPIRNASLAAGVVQRYQRGRSTPDIANELGISLSTVQRILREEGIQLRSPFDHHQSLPLTADGSDSSLVESQAVESQAVEAQAVESQAVEAQAVEPQAVEVQIVEATSIPYASPLDRLATTMGWIEESPVEYQSGEGVPCAGVLLGLALLEETYLVEEARAVYGKLRNGWYGLRSLLWTLVVMALLRIKRPEQLKRYDPVALGTVLGMPRVAEVKTIRRKLEELSLLGKAGEWHRELARRRAEENPTALASLYIDGHVRAYHGIHRIGKTRVSRLKRVMRAEEDYWVHQAQGQPLLVVHESVDSSFREALCNRVLPEIREVIGDRRVRIVFDREGWSRELFSDLLRLNFNFITYRKGNYEPLPDSEFQEVVFKIPGQPEIKYELAESTLDEDGWPKLRLIALKKKNGGQTQVVASGQATWQSLGLDPGDPDPSAAEIAWIVLGRWSQENWFKYMRQEYALDVLVDYSVELDDQEHLVVNPQWRDLDRQVASARGRLERSQAKYTKLTMQLDELIAASQFPAKRNPPSQLSRTATPPGDQSAPPAKSGSSKRKDAKLEDLQQRCREQAADVSRLSAELDLLRAERKATDKKIPLREAADRDKVRLSYERKLFTDTVKLSAYEIETRLYTMLGESYSNSATEGRGIIQTLLTASGDIRVQGDLIEVHLDQLSAPRYTQAMQSLCQQLNARSPRLPETEYQLRFHVKPRPTGE
jgi:hypothetical protein